VTVSLSQTWANAVSKLDNQERLRAWDFAMKINENPANPGISFERAQQAASDNIWSGRISQGLRAILYHKGQDYVLLYADQHDAAFEWARRHRFEPDKRTGEMQIVRVAETILENLDWTRHAQSAAPKLFAPYDDKYLSSIGIPSDYLPLIRLIETEDQLLELEGKLPDNVEEMLYSLADGKLITPPSEAEEPPAPVIRPSEQIWVLESQADLEAVLGKPFEAWLRYLHPSQRKIVDAQYSGPAKVSGAAGTGKTVVAVHRARHLAQQGKKVLLTSFVNTLCCNLVRSVDLLCDESERPNITVSTVSKEGLALFKKIEKGFGSASDNDCDEVVKEFAFLAPEFEKPFLVSEWRHVVAAQGLMYWDEYQEASRTGRARPLSMQQRRSAWTVFERALEELRKRRKLPWFVIFAQLTEALTAGSIRGPYDAILVDEVQDLSGPQLRFLAALGKHSRENFMVVGDAGQRLYPGGYSLTKLGIDIRGRSSVLRINYRTTREIQRAAERLRGKAVDDLDGGSEGTRTRCLLTGPEPRFSGFANAREQSTFLTDELRNLISSGVQPQEIAIFARTRDVLNRIQGALDAEDIPAILLQDESDLGAIRDVVLSTMHRAKGLEFRHVFVVNCSSDMVPNRYVLSLALDDLERAATEVLERQLLYVSLTRARDQVTVTWFGEPSPYLAPFLEKEPA
jgi:Cdc6-like AAA superfamily ATPase